MKNWKGTSWDIKRRAGHEISFTDKPLKLYI